MVDIETAMVEPTYPDRCNGEDGYSAGMVRVGLCMRTRDDVICELCGRRGLSASQARDAADEARELIAQLLGQYGTVRTLSRAFAARHRVKPQTAERQFYRLTAGQRSLFKMTFLDELRDMV
jgi:hypothetical protein